MEIRIVHYKYDLKNHTERSAYEDMCKKLRENGFKNFSCLHMRSDKNPSEMPEIQNLDPKHLFENQFNTVEGFRVFDWYEPIYDNRSWKCGYYITIPSKVALDEFRRKYVKCGYCGCQEEDHGQILHRGCLGSQYLKITDLHLCFFQPILDTPRWRDVLPEYQEAYLTAQADAKILYAKAQKKRLKEVGKKLIADAKTKSKEIIEDARIQNIVCLHGIDPFNLIHYRGGKGWVFGWREPMSQEESERIRSLDLGFDYTIKMKDGTTR